MTARAWPFEQRPEPRALHVHAPEDFAASIEGVDAVVIRSGLNVTSLVLVDGDGRWERFTYHDEAEAVAAAEGLGLTAHMGDYPEAVRVRMNAYRRPAEDFDLAAYPEQGRVGPVIPYPENRPRRVPDAARAGEDPDVEQRPGRP